MDGFLRFLPCLPLLLPARCFSELCWLAGMPLAGARPAWLQTSTCTSRQRDAYRPFALRLNRHGAKNRACLPPSTRGSSRDWFLFLPLPNYAWRCTCSRYSPFACRCAFHATTPGNLPASLVRATYLLPCATTFLLTRPPIFSYARKRA